MRLTIQDIRTNLGITNTYDIVNAIRNSSGDSFKNYVPLASAENIAQVGAGILINQTIQNEFITNLIDRIGLVVVKKASLQNPLKKFKKGAMPFGRTIEEIYTDITTAKKYNPKESESTLFKRNMPNVKTLFHERNRQEFYKLTVQDESLKSAFTSWNNFENFVSSIMNAIYNSAEVDEYENMKLLIDNYYSKGLFTVVPVDKVTDVSKATKFVKKVRATAKRMTLHNGSTEYNALAVRTRSEMDDLHLFISPEIDAEIEVEVLAKAFNMDKTEFLGHVTVIDGFSSVGLEGVLVDKDWFMVYDNLHKLETVRNAEGLYWNYIYHVWQTLSASRFANAVAFVSEEVPTVTQVIVTPTISTVKAGETLQLDAIVRSTDGVERTVTWDVVASTSGTTLQAGTEVDENGLLTVASNQTGEVRVTATVDRDDTAGTENVVGEAIITIQ